MEFDELLNRTCNGNISIAVDVVLQLSDSLLQMLKSTTENKFSETLSRIKGNIFEKLVEEKCKRQCCPRFHAFSGYTRPKPLECITQTSESRRSKIMRANPWIPPLPFHVAKKYVDNGESNEPFRDECWVGLWLNEPVHEIRRRIGPSWSRYLPAMVFDYQLIKNKKKEIIKYVVEGHKNSDIGNMVGPKWVELICFIHRNCQEEIDAEQTQNIMKCLSECWSPKRFLEKFGVKWEPLVIKIWNTRYREIETARARFIANLFASGKDVETIMNEYEIEVKDMSKLFAYNGMYIDHKVNQIKRKWSGWNTALQWEAHNGRKETDIYPNGNKRLRLLDAKFVERNGQHTV